MGWGAANAHQRGARPTQLVPPGTGAHQVLSFTGPITGVSQTTHEVWLPDQITMPGGGTHTYGMFPSYGTVMLQHGKGANAAGMRTATLQRLKDAITAGQIPPVIAIFPNAGNNWYCDAFDGSVRMETQVFLELLLYVEARTRAFGCGKKRAIMGFSMGGWGALHLGLKYRQSFAAICAYGAPNLDADSNNNWAGSDATDYAAIFNSSPTILRPQSPCATVGGNGLVEAKTAELIEAAHPIRIVKSAADSVSLASLNNFDARLTARGIAHTFVDLVTPTHNVGQYFTADAGAGFAFVSAAMAAA